MTLAEAPSTRRVHEIDAVRGFALAGILVANIGFFADPGYAVGTGTMPITEGPVAYLVSTLVLTKFYILFSFLFGYSFTLQTRDGVNVKARMLRRCLGLFVIGLLHGFLLWIGDILTLYATLGLILLAMRNISPRKAVITGCAIIGVMSVIWLLLAGLTLLGPAGGAAVTDPAAAAQAEALVTGGPLDFLTFQARTYPAIAGMVWIGQGPMALALFLFGLAAGKSRLFEEPERWARFVPRVQWVGFGVGLPAAAFFTWATASGEDALELAALALNNVTSVLLTAAYVVTLLQIIKRFPAAGRALAPAGRMAASNYLGQSALCCLVFTGYGLALAGKLSPLAVMGVAAVIYAILLGLSRWWLRGHRYGPIEYGLRRLTVGRG